MAASMRNPVVVILGATGTGKTKLSLELARLFNGEIISADAMQLYKGLDIITNKATPEERQLCPHHMIDYIAPLKDNNTVVDYRNQTVPIIDSLLKKEKMPVIVGGTNYYIEAVLWKHLVNSEDVKRASTLLQQRRSKIPKLEVEEKLTAESDSTEVTKDQEESAEDAKKASDTDSDDSYDSEAVMRGEREKYESLGNQELYQRLCEVDPESANRIHPKDRRKVIRAIEVFDQHGIPRSVVYKAQHTDLSDDAIRGPLRYSDTCIFWLHCEREVLNKRLDDRVDKMMEMGLVEELTQFHKQYNDDRIKHRKEADYTTGIFQSIGFKEFHDYLILNEDDRHSEKGKQLLETGIENLKVATRRYASYQIRWVKRRLLKRPCKESVPSVYGLDCTDVSRWEELVSTPASTILTTLRKGEDSPIAPLLHNEEEAQEFKYNECKICGVVAVTKQSWEIHMSSRRHKKALQHHRKLSRNLTTTLDTYIQQKQSSQTAKEEES